MYFFCQKFRSQTLSIMRQALTLLQIFAISQFGCGGREFQKNLLKRTTKGNHWGYDVFSMFQWLLKALSSSLLTVHWADKDVTDWLKTVSTKALGKWNENEFQPSESLSYLYLTCGANACGKQNPSTEATTWAHCTILTDLKISRSSWKLWQTSRGETSGYYSKVSNERV